MSADDQTGPEEDQTSEAADASPPLHRSRGMLGRLRVSGYNALVAVVFVVLGVVVMLTTGWWISIVLIVTGFLQYIAALIVRAAGVGNDVMRVTFFEPVDERDRAIRLRASAIVGDTVSLGSLVAFLVAFAVEGRDSTLALYLAWQTVAISLFWIVLIWIVARRS